MNSFLSRVSARPHRGSSIYEYECMMKCSFESTNTLTMTHRFSRRNVKKNNARSSVCGEVMNFIAGRPTARCTPSVITDHFPFELHLYPPSPEILPSSRFSLLLVIFRQSSFLLVCLSVCVDFGPQV